LEFDASLSHGQHGLAQRLERWGELPGVAQAHLERRRPGELEQLRVHAGALTALVGAEEDALDAMSASEAGLRLDRLDAYLERVLVDELGYMRIALDGGAGEDLDRRLGADGFVVAH